MASNSTELATDKHKNPIYAVGFADNTQSFQLTANAELGVNLITGFSIVNFSFDKADNVYVSEQPGITIPINATIITHPQEKNPSQRVLIEENGAK